jgi:3'-5' exoribonuclease
METKAIKELRPGEVVTSFFVLRKKELKTKRDSEEMYASLEFGDASGRIRGSLWDNVKSTYENLKVGTVVKVKCRTVEFNDRLHLNVDQIRTAEERDEVDFARLVPVVKKDRDKLQAHLDELIESVEQPHLNKLLAAIFQDAEIRTRFYDAPAGKLWHHGYLGGLLEHTLAVTDISEKVSQMYPDVDRDLLVAGGLLHDIGKISTYEYKTLIDYTDEGRLLGHIVIGAQLVEERIKSIPDFPTAVKTELLHLILSHQGKLEQASPVVPMTLEALILYYADELDSKANAFTRIRNKDKRSGAKWSSFVRLLDRYLYLGEEQEAKPTAESTGPKTTPPSKAKKDKA